MNGDQLEPGQFAVSTSNRNFEGRQGKGGRTLSGITIHGSRCCGCRSDHRRANNDEGLTGDDDEQVSSTISGRGWYLS